MSRDCDTDATRRNASAPYTADQQPIFDLATEGCRVQASRTRRWGRSLIAGLWGERRRPAAQVADTPVAVPAPALLSRALRVPRWPSLPRPLHVPPWLPRLLGIAAA